MVNRLRSEAPLYLWNTDAIFGKDNRAEFAFFLQRNNRHLVGFDRDILPDFAKNRRGNVDIVGPGFSSRPPPRLFSSSIEVELILYRFGWNAVDTTVLIESLDTLRMQLRELVAVAEPMTA